MQASSSKRSNRPRSSKHPLQYNPNNYPEQISVRFAEWIYQHWSGFPDATLYTSLRAKWLTIKELCVQRDLAGILFRILSIGRRGRRKLWRVAKMDGLTCFNRATPWDNITRDWARTNESSHGVNPVRQNDLVLVFTMYIYIFVIQYFSRENQKVMC